MDTTRTQRQLERFPGLSKCGRIRVAIAVMATASTCGSTAFAQADDTFSQVKFADSLTGQFAELTDTDDPRRMRIVSEPNMLGMVTVEFCGQEGTATLHTSSYETVRIDCKDRKIGSFSVLNDDLTGIPVFTAGYAEIGSIVANSQPNETSLMTSIRLVEPAWGETPYDLQLEAYDAFISVGTNGQPALILGAEKTKAIADFISGNN